MKSMRMTAIRMAGLNVIHLNGDWDLDQQRKGTLGQGESMREDQKDGWRRGDLASDLTRGEGAHWWVLRAIAFIEQIQSQIMSDPDQGKGVRQEKR